MTEQRKNGQNIPRGSGAEKEPHVIKMPLRLLDNFPKHPYYVFDDDDMLELMESIRKNGLIFPLIVRRKNDRYELISGHRGKHACELLGHKEIACRIADVTDDEAIIMMVDSNCQRTKLLTSERAYDVLKNQKTSLRLIKALMQSAGEIQLRGCMGKSLHFLIQFWHVFRV